VPPINTRSVDSKPACKSTTTITTMCTTKEYHTRLQQEPVVGEVDVVGLAVILKKLLPRVEVAT
jgi:hypothetical protein